MNCNNKIQFMHCVMTEKATCKPSLNFHSAVVVRVKWSWIMSSETI